MRMSGASSRRRDISRPYAYMYVVRSLPCGVSGSGGLDRHAGDLEVVARGGERIEIEIAARRRRWDGGADAPPAGALHREDGEPGEDEAEEGDGDAGGAPP